MNPLNQSFQQLYIFSKLFGVLPCSFDAKSKTFRKSLLAQLYTALLLLIATLTYARLIRSFVRRVDENTKSQAVGSSIVGIYRFINFGLMLTLTLQLYYQKQIINFLNSGLKIAGILLRHTSPSYSCNFYKLHLAQLTMLVLWWILLVLLLLSFFVNPDLIDILCAIAVVSPVIGMSVMSAAFVLCIGLLLQGYTVISEQIRLITVIPKSLTKQCQLSDNLDYLNNYYSQLNDLLRTLVHVLSVPIFVFISISFANTVRGVRLLKSLKSFMCKNANLSFQCIMQYLILTNRAPRANLILSSIVLVTFLSLTVTYVRLSSMLTSKIRNIGHNLHSIELDHGVDSRLTRTVSHLTQFCIVSYCHLCQIELFSIQVYQDQPGVVIFSMLEINNAMLYSVSIK
jgi:7tm Chemosensory receptor